jgi:hypothetical protein
MNAICQTKGSWDESISIFNVSCLFFDKKRKEARARLPRSPVDHLTERQQRARNNPSRTVPLVLVFGEKKKACNTTKGSLGFRVTCTIKTARERKDLEFV